MSGTYPYLKRFTAAEQLDTNEAFRAGVESCFQTIEQMGYTLSFRKRLASDMKLTTKARKELGLEPLTPPK